MARHFRGSGIVLRFIEYMDVGATNGWRMDEVLPSAQVIEPHAARACRSKPLEPSAAARPPSAGAIVDGGGEIGVISSVTQAFCRDCNRARLSTEGKLFLCLFASTGHDLRTLLRGGASDEQIAAAIAAHLAPARRPLLRAARRRATRPRRRAQRRVEMHYIGG